MTNDCREAYEGADHVIALEDEVTRLLERIAELEAERVRYLTGHDSSALLMAKRVAELESEVARLTAALGET